MALTPKQIQELRAKYNIGNTPATASKPGFMDQAKGVVKSGFNKYVEIAAPRAKDYAETFLPINGNIPVDPMNKARRLASMVGVVQDFAGAGAQEVASRVLPQSIKDPIKGAIGSVVGSEPVQKAMQAYERLKVSNPRLAKDLGAVIDLAGALGIGKGAQVTGSAAKSVAVKGGQKALSAVDDVKVAAKSALKDTRTAARNQLTPFEDGVETVLRSGENNGTLTKAAMAQKLQRYEDQARVAITDYSKPTPLELAGDEAAKSLSILQNTLKKTGEAKKALTKTIATKPVGTTVQDARSALRSGLEERVGVRLTKDGKLQRIKGRTATISDKSDLKLLTDIDRKLASISRFPTFQMVDDAVDYIQDALYKRSSLTAVPVNSKVEGILKNVSKDLTKRLREIGGNDYTNLNLRYSNTKTIFDKLNKALGADGNKGASLMKQLFSPNGTASRKLFDEIKKRTGIDLVQEATLAKFVMENIGDVRQASLLEQVLRGQVSPTKSGIIDFAAKKILQKVQDPLKKAKDIVDQRSY